MVGLDGYLQRPNTCPDRAVPPDDEELSHTHTLVRVKNTTRIVPTVVTSRVHCAMGKNFSFSFRLRSIYYLWSNTLHCMYMYMYMYIFSVVLYCIVILHLCIVCGTCTFVHVHVCTCIHLYCDKMVLTTLLGTVGAKKNFP